MTARASAIAATSSKASISPSALGAYGLLGMPLAMAALPLYVHLPKFYGDHLGVSLTALGLLLLALRIADGIVDPLLGAWSDRAASRKWLIGLAMPALAIGMLALFAPPATDETGLLVWLGAALALTYAAFSLATINHNAWGAELSRDPVERTRITATRETLALIGVVIASVAPILLGGAGGEAAGLPRFAVAFAAICVGCTLVTLRWAPAARRNVASASRLRARIAAPLADPLFRRLLLVFMANGI
ncbi:MAG: MFS transporter, partial [Betaproteobacteria bacterium]|nr:MFS transporter [Betaproteobacteria bacterium]